jgi:hypothetical protein
MNNLLSITLLFLIFSTNLSAYNVIIQNDSDHAVQIYASHTCYIPSFMSSDKKWYYVAPHQSINVKAHDTDNTRIYMYRLNLKAALSNAVYLGGVYAGSTALTVTNAFAWIPAAAIAARTTYIGFPFTMQIINPDTKMEAGKIPAILIQNYKQNKDTIQSVQAIASLNMVIDTILENIGLMVNDNHEFIDAYNSLVKDLNYSWGFYQKASKLELDLTKAAGSKIKNAQQKSVSKTIEDLVPIIAQLPELAAEFEELKELQGINFYIEFIKFAQKINDIRSSEVVEVRSIESEKENLLDPSLINADQLCPREESS